MTDHYNMNQYNKETSQIHAPTDLIRRTKEAVRKEEQRIASERLQQNTAAQPRHFYGKVYKWALPVAAAALCVILLNISGMMIGRNMGGSLSGSSMDMASGTAPSGGNDMGMQSEAGDNSESVVITADESVNEDIEYETVAMDTGGEEYVDEKNSIREESELEKGKNSYIDSIYGTNIWMEETEEIPAFYDNPDTECVTIQGVELYVGKDFDEAWIAYAETDVGKFIISTEMTEEEITQEEFVQAAYEVLIEIFS